MKVAVFGHNLGQHERILQTSLNILNGVQRFFYCTYYNQTIPNLPESGDLNPNIAMNQLEEMLDQYENIILITSSRFDDNWFSHESRRTSIISFYDWETRYAPPSLRAYLLYQIAQSLLVFAADISEEMGLRFVHEPPIGCINDFCRMKPDIRFGLVAGNICPNCEASLRQFGLRSEALDAIYRILANVRAETTGRAQILDPSEAFIVMRFSENDENDNAYQYGIKPGLLDVGFQPFRADMTLSSAQILDQIRQYITRSRIVVAKIDEINLNVYFELGYAMGSDKDVLLISSHDKILQLVDLLLPWQG